MNQTALYSKQEIGGLMPDIALPDLSGSFRDLSSILEGKKGAVVVFWSSSCAHCRRYDGYLNGLLLKYPEIGLVAITSQGMSELEQIRAAVQNRALRFPILHDSAGIVARRWCTRQTPRVFLINSAKRLLYRGAVDNLKQPIGPDYKTYLDPAIAAFLSGTPIERSETASFGCAIQLGA
jgi:thiol-disulfide isomerase/thioredoxin